MYLIYSDLNGDLADYSLRSEASCADAPLPRENARGPASAKAAAAPSQRITLLRRVDSLWPAHGLLNRAALHPADKPKGERS
ncbi:hypothetical protein LMG27174_03489 [Paraburkholderia rhynchosiae]|uniref:Uncharacterized protein n=1 Tax=Paraburkholderia rhynchosiae TaxID=487049 RepID=A0A2N7WKC2_9BURK|nr:hypothetical protein C0Z16_17595 [Paraburkholderia rhynchosiae]CAB3697461.1 hypothetical protein LMG27174_03489 [Paraburkholderia rhynchosiae]